MTTNLMGLTKKTLVDRLRGAEDEVQLLRDDIEALTPGEMAYLVIDLDRTGEASLGIEGVFLNLQDADSYLQALMDRARRKKVALPRLEVETRPLNPNPKKAELREGKRGAADVSTSLTIGPGKARRNLFGWGVDGIALSQALSDAAALFLAKKKVVGKWLIEATLDYRKSEAKKS